MAWAAAAKKCPRLSHWRSSVGPTSLQISLVHKSGGLKCLARPLLSQMASGQLSEFVVNQWQQLVGRLGVALFDRRKNAGDFVHRLWPPEVPHSAPAHGEVRRSDRLAGLSPGDRRVSFESNDYTRGKPGLIQRANRPI